MEKTIKIRGTGANESYTITVPKEMIKVLNWRKGQKIVIKKQGKRLIIEDWEKRKG